MTHPLEVCRNLHAGKRGFILATGPSVGEQDISWLRNEIVIGVNFAHKITCPQGWTPTYMVTADARLVPLLQDDWQKLKTGVVVTDTVMLKNPYKHPNLISGPGISLKYASDKFVFDCASPPIYVPQAYSTVGHAALPWACFLGLNPIYLLGCDCTAKGHAYDDKGACCAKAMEYWKTHFMPAMRTIRKVVEPQGIRIFNATRGGNLEEFERVFFESLKGA